MKRKQRVKSRIVKKWDGSDVYLDSKRRLERMTLRQLIAHIEDEPDDYAARVILAERQLNLKHPQKTIDLLASKNIEVTTDDALLHARGTRALAFAYAESGDWKKAQSIAESYLVAHESALDFHYLLAYVGQQAGSIALCERHANAYLTIQRNKPTNALATLQGTARRRYEVLNYLGLALEDTNRLSEAIKCFEQAVRAKSTYDIAWVNLIRVQMKAGHKTDAEHSLVRARRAVPKSTLLRKTTVSAHGTASSGPRVSLCMIVKNEEEHLERCLRSVRDLVDQIVVVDTGSTDRTVAIAESFGAEVHHHEWEGDFSKARNISMGYADRDWIFIMDADEELDTKDVSVIRRSIDETDFRLIAISIYNYSHRQQAYTSFLPSIRFVRRDLGALYDGIVHNQLRYPADEAVLRIPARLYHYGYGLEPEAMARKVARSRALLERQLEDDPDFAFAHFNLAQLLRGADTGEAAETMQEVIAHARRAVELSSPTDQAERHIHIMALHQLVTAYTATKEYDKAVQHALRTLELKPGYLDALLSLGHIHALQHDLNKSRHYYLEYLKHQRAYQEHTETDHIILLHLHSRHNALYGLGLIAQMEGNPREAADWFERCLSESGDYLDCHYRLGSCNVAMGDWERAIQEFRQELKLHPLHHDARRELIVIHDQAQDKDSVRSLLSDWHSSGTLDRALLIRYIQLELDEGDPERALELIAALDPHDRETDGILRLHADAHYAHGNWMEAAGLYERCLERHGDDSVAQNNLGNCRFQMGDCDKAESIYRTLIDKGEAESFVYRNLGLSLAKQNRFADAIFTLETYLEMEPLDFECAGLLGDLYCHAGEFSKAIDQYELMIEADPDRVEPLIRLADCYLRQGSLQAALSGYEAALNLEPQNETVWSRLRDVRAYLTDQQEETQDAAVSAASES